MYVGKVLGDYVSYVNPCGWLNRTMVISYGIGIKPKSLSTSHTIHLAWSTQGCWLNLAKHSLDLHRTSISTTYLFYTQRIPMDFGSNLTTPSQVASESVRR
jgi:hypothetical protein